VKTISADSFSAQDSQQRPARGAGGSGNNDPSGGDAYYRTRISLDDIKLHDTPAGFHIVPGMPVTADIKVGKRTMLAYLLGRVLPITHEAMREP